MGPAVTSSTNESMNKISMIIKYLFVFIHCIVSFNIFKNMIIKIFSYTISKNPNPQKY